MTFEKAHFLVKVKRNSDKLHLIVISSNSTLESKTQDIVSTLFSQGPTSYSHKQHSKIGLFPMNRDLSNFHEYSRNG